MSTYNIGFHGDIRKNTYLDIPPIYAFLFDSTSEKK